MKPAARGQPAPAWTRADSYPRLGAASPAMRACVQYVEGEAAPSRPCSYPKSRLCKRHALLAGMLAYAWLELPATAPAGIVEDWNEAFEASIQVEATPPALAARNLAILHGAIHDALAVPAGACVPMLVRDRPPAPPALQPELAAWAAGQAVCAALFPARTGAFPTPPATNAASAASLAYGQRVAQLALAARAADGSATTVHYVPRDGPGQWRRTTHNRPPELPHWPGVRPFALASADQFRPPPPPAPDAPAFVAALDAVRALGGRASTVRTDDQTQAARFWSDFAYTATPPGHWNRIARDRARHAGLSLHASACLFAVLNVALADAGLACFDTKYHYNFWRPVTALRARGDTDWESLLPCPSHPEYPSGHATFSAAAATVLAAFSLEPSEPFAVTSDALPGVTRRYDNFAACAREIADSRVWGGLHFAFSGDAGLALGAAVARHVLAVHPPPPARRP